MRGISIALTYPLVLCARDAEEDSPATNCKVKCLIPFLGLPSSSTWKFPLLPYTSHNAYAYNTEQASSCSIVENWVALKKRLLSTMVPVMALHMRTIYLSSPESTTVTLALGVPELEP